MITPDFKLYYRALVTKTAWYWHKTNTKTKATKHPEIKPHSCSHLIFDKEAKNIHC
jgi:hypothetical protein